MQSNRWLASQTVKRCTCTYRTLPFSVLFCPSRPTGGQWNRVNERSWRDRRNARRKIALPFSRIWLQSTGALDLVKSSNSNAVCQAPHYNIFHHTRWSVTFVIQSPSRRLEVQAKQRFTLPFGVLGRLALGSSTRNTKSEDLLLAWKRAFIFDTMIWGIFYPNSTWSMIRKPCYRNAFSSAITTYAHVASMSTSSIDTSLRMMMMKQ